MITAVIPVHNFVAGAQRVAEWVEHAYSRRFGDTDWRLIVVDDHSNDFSFRPTRNCEVLYNRSQDKLKGSLGMAARALSGNTQIVHIIETDAVPSDTTFDAMIKVWHDWPSQSLPSQPIGSISPTYEWNGEPCYPVHRHWTTDPDSGVNLGVGKITDVGRAGVPFLFSLWNAKVFRQVDQPGFPAFMKLDTYFGGWVHEQGYKHLRLMDHAIEHYCSGRMSHTR